MKYRKRKKNHDVKDRGSLREVVENRQPRHTVSLNSIGFCLRQPRDQDEQTLVLAFKSSLLSSIHFLY